uniref:Uncharacterized protein n=1 Tax=Glossina palpalis gambiensis TaxID=67801 RepID=A0A1B0ATX5_9MUSC
MQMCKICFNFETGEKAFITQVECGSAYSLVNGNKALAGVLVGDNAVASVYWLSAFLRYFFFLQQHINEELMRNVSKIFPYNYEN